MGPDPELPPDLAMLGDRLEQAAARSLRRHARRQAILNGIAAVALAVPLALAVSATDLAPSSGERLLPLTAAPFSGDEVAHIRDERAAATREPVERVCLDANDCRSPAEPSRQLAPVGRI